MEPTLTGDSIALVVRLQAAADGKWYVCIEGANVGEQFPLVPATLVLRLWRADEANVLRGTVQLHGSQHSAMFHGNRQLVDLVRAWLVGNDSIHLDSSKER